MRSSALTKSLVFILTTLLASTAACGSDDSAGPADPDGGGPPGTGDGGEADANHGDGPAPDLSKCGDGIRNAAETDLDCGGGCAPCGQCGRCKVAADCETGNCLDGLCAPLVQGLPNLDPARRKLHNLVAAVESGMRCDVGLYSEIVGVVGRELYRFSQKEERYVTELLGGGASELKGDAFYVARPWATRYWVAQHAKQLEDTSAAANEIPEAEKKGYAAFARTVVAYQLLVNLALSDDKGLRIDLADTTQAPKTKAEVLEHIALLLDEAKAELVTGTINFPLSSGFAEFTTAQGFTKFNRALAARVAAYRQQWAAVLTALNESFFDLNGSMTAGVYHRFTDVPGDQRNPLFFAQNATGEVRVAHPDYVADLVPGDNRAKTTPRAVAASQSGLTGNRDVWVYSSDTAPIPILRNEELILLYAEAKIQLSSVPDAIVAFNRIRIAHNLGVYAGSTSPAALLTELLHQRRYSLFLEGHRWVDLRRYSRLAELPADRPGDDVWPSFPIPPNDGAE